MNIECIILAAGLSTRMGRNKMLLEIDGVTVIERCLYAFLESCSRVIVVTGKYHDDIDQCLTPYSKVQTVYNEHYQQGMFSSIKAGVRNIRAERFFLTPGDYPLLETETIRYMTSVAGRFVSPLYKEQQGHPILLDKSFVPLIIASASCSLRDCLKGEAAVKVPVDDAGILADIDTMDDYNNIIKGS